MIPAPDEGQPGETKPFKVLSPGTTISHYRIIEKIGQGGMGVVYKAEDTKLRRTVALKFLPPHLTEDPHARERFVHEAQAASALDHHNICTIHEIDETEDGHTFISMACYEGETLRERMERGSLDLDEVLGIGLQILEGLTKAHSKGIVHRDLKPANIMLTGDGVAKIMDFGLAKLAGRMKITRTGTTMGTPAYMSPEQAQGQEVDERSDIFSLGVILYEMIAGRPPFKGEYEAAVLHSILYEEPEPATRLRHELPTELERIISKSLNKDRDSRYRDASEILHDLTRVKTSIDSAAAARGSSEEASRLSIAVLPFANLSADPEQEYFCDGITEELINALTQVEGLRVVARTSSFAFKGKHEDIREIGRRLSVDTVVEGSVRKSGDKLRITAQVVKVADGYHLWSQKFDRELKDIFAIQDEISAQITGKLKVDLTGVGGTEVTKRHTDDVEAYNLYLRGRYLWNKRTREGLNKAIEYFKQAIKQSPGYALAYVGLADCHTALINYGFGPAKKLMPAAKSAVKKALDLDDSLAEAHATAGWITANLDLDWAAGEVHYRRSIRLSPRYATTHHWYALHLAAVGRFGEAIAEAEVAQSIDPLSLAIGMALGAVFYWAKQFGRAIEELQKVLEMDSDFAPARDFLALAYLEKGMHNEAQGVIEDLVVSFPGNPGYIADMACVYARMGNRAKAENVLKELEAMSEREYVPPYVLAQVCGCLGMNDEAFAYLDKALDDLYGIDLLKLDLLLDDLRSDARFIRLLEKAGLAE